LWRFLPKVVIRPKITFWLLAGGSVLCLLLVLLNRRGGQIRTLFSVTSVSCTLAKQNCPTEIRQQLDQLLQKPIFVINAQYIQKILAQFPNVTVIAVGKQFSRLVTVRLAENPPAAAVSLPAHNSWYLVTAQGGVVGEASEPGDLPRLTVNNEDWLLRDRTFTSDLVKQGLRLTIYMSKKYPQVTAELLKPADLAVYIDGQKILFSLIKDPVVSLATLQLVLSDLTIQTRRPTVIDLRFQNPIIAL
jgi:cell division septal protein FtsQ